MNENQFLGEISEAKDLLVRAPFDSASSLKALDVGVGIGKTMIALGRAGFDAWALSRL